MNKKLLSVSIASVIISTSLSNIILQDHKIAHADSTTPENTTVDLQKYDKYITVSQGKYVANLPSDTPAEIVKSINNSLKTTNDSLSASGNFIDPTTKEIVNEASLLESSKRPSHQIKKYYWGVKHIFRTNAAVDYQAGKWESASRRILLMSLVPGVAVVGIPSAGYADLLAHDLRNYNSAHQKSKIYMNVTNYFKYSFGIWKD
ncbi:hypothetical protein BHU61_07745 [Macrococcus epidermidis]|uniref:Uncharacterized protein n=1 Tax=Macrococcus epidermidis TaxID=1902580 RepID=A0A327ZUB5_9STAP|nr:hypothetical protein [Macrococcus epidermidis]RAK44598.1 hypothetical protein BHU61_07745 [Macrococcus epidermidis]